LEKVGHNLLLFGKKKKGEDQKRQIKRVQREISKELLSEKGRSKKGKKQKKAIGGKKRLKPWVPRGVPSEGMNHEEAQSGNVFVRSRKDFIHWGGEEKLIQGGV